MKPNQQHAFLTPTFQEWPVSDAHRQPVMTLIDGVVSVLDSLGMEASIEEVQEFLLSLPATSRSAQVISDAQTYLRIRREKLGSLSEKQMSLLAGDSARS